MDADAAVTTTELPLLQQQWVQLLDESSSTFYYANVVTRETSWDAPPSFIKHEDIQTSFEPLVDAQSEVVPTTENVCEHRSDNDNRSSSNIVSHDEEDPLSPLEDTALPNASAPTPRTQSPPLTLHALIPERPSKSSETQELRKKKLDNHTATIAPTESHPLFEFASRHYNLESPPKSLFFGLTPRPPQQRLDVRARLYWESGLIASPITQLPKEQTKVALQAFRNISGFMGNRSSGKGQIDHCFKLLRNVAIKSHRLKDEVYCQICKQLTGNPDISAVLNGWLLLNACLITFPPSKELSPYLERFFTQHFSTEVPEIAQYAKDALDSLQSCFKKGDRKELLSLMEIQALRDHSLIEICIALLDGSLVKASVSAWTTCRELASLVSEKLGIHTTQAFALFETSSFNEERVLESDERVLDLYALWERIEIEQEPKATKKKASKAKATQNVKHGQPRSSSSNRQSDGPAYKLVYKAYLWIDVDDELVAEIHMFYLQAVHSIVTGVYACSLDTCVELASLQLHCRLSTEQFADEKTDLLRTVEQYVPPNVLTPANRLHVCDRILTAHSSLRETSVHACKLLYLRMCRTLCFYGATFFAAHNTRNPRIASEVVVAVSCTGVSIVSVENETALAQYVYADIASWGYSSNAFVFVADQGDDETEHVLKTTAGKHINDLIAAYVKYILSLPAST